MKMRIIAAGVLAGAAACSSPPGPAPQGADPGPPSASRAGEGRSVYALIGARERLELSSSQVNTLDSIGEAIRRANRPLSDSLRSIADARGGPLAPPRDSADRAAFAAVLRAMDENNRVALQAVHDALTPGQRLIACELARQAQGERSAGPRGGGGRRGPPSGGRRPGMRGGAPSGNPANFAGRTWPWCAEPRPGADSVTRADARPRV